MQEYRRPSLCEPTACAPEIVAVRGCGGGVPLLCVILRVLVCFGLGRFCLLRSISEMGLTPGGSTRSGCCWMIREKSVHVLAVPARSLRGAGGMAAPRLELMTGPAGLGAMPRAAPCVCSAVLVGVSPA